MSGGAIATPQKAVCNDGVRAGNADVPMSGGRRGAPIATAGEASHRQCAIRGGVGAQAAAPVQTYLAFNGHSYGQSDLEGPPNRCYSTYPD